MQEKKQFRLFATQVANNSLLWCLTSQPNISKMILRVYGLNQWFFVNVA